MKIVDVHENDMKHRKGYIIGLEVVDSDLHESDYEGYKAGSVTVNRNGKSEYHYFLAVKLKD